MHPGGPAWIAVCAGTECTRLFEMMHVNTAQSRAALRGIVSVGEYVQDTQDDYAALRRAQMLMNLPGLAPPVVAPPARQPRREARQRGCAGEPRAPAPRRRGRRTRRMSSPRTPARAPSERSACAAPTRRQPVRLAGLRTAPGPALPRACFSWPTTCLCAGSLSSGGRSRAGGRGECGGRGESQGECRSRRRCGAERWLSRRASSQGRRQGTRGWCWASCN